MLSGGYKRYQDILRARFVPQVKCIGRDALEEQEPLMIFKAVGLPRRYVDVLWTVCHQQKTFTWQFTAWNTHP